MSQNDKVLRWLKRRSLSPMQALSHLGIYRLAARVYDLREKGYVIATEQVRSKGRNITRYRLSERI